MTTGISFAGRNGRRAATALATASLAAGLGFGLAPSAGAAPSDAGRAAAKVTVQVTQKGNYTATLCVTDNLGGTCRSGVRQGQTRTFTVQPAKGTPVNVRVVVDGGGSDEKSLVTGKSVVKAETAGSKAKPTVKFLS